MNNSRNVQLSPFVLFCQKVIPLAFDESMSYYECLCALVNFLHNEVVPAVNQNADAVTELQNYVANYFENLDVQDEINNKLDEMAESGQLAEIINAFIQSDAIIGFDNVANMSESDILIEGSFARTFSYEEINDGLGAFYKVRQITSGDVVDGYNIVALDSDPTLIAERMIDKNINDLSDAVDSIEDNIDEINQNLDHSLNPIGFYSGKNLVVFGDSFTEEGITNSVNAHWVSRVCSATGLISKNFAVAGAGFGRASNLVSTQLTTALETLTQEEIDNTAVVIIYAGCNDIIYHLDEGDIVDNCSQLVHDVQSNFPNAKIILAPFNWGYNYLTTADNIWIETMINKISRNISDCPAVTLKLARYWCLGIRSYFQNSVHPNASGYNKIASYFIGAIYGNSEHVCIGEDKSDTLSEGLSDGRYLMYDCQDGIVHLSFAITYGSNLTNYSNIIQSSLPALLTPDKNIFIPLYKTSDYADCGYIRLTPSGVIAIHISSLPANTQVFASPISFKANANVDY